jgi:monovalent cation:H+ antiporter-2, CPA2 family
MHSSFVEQLLIVLTTGLLSGAVCRQVGLPPLTGYLVIGALLSDGVLGWVSDDTDEVAHLAELGVFFLLFSIGLELSLEELRKMGRHLLIGGTAQMVLVALPVTMILLAREWSWNAALLVAAALAFSSTVLVFKSLGEMGQTSTPLGRRAVSILLFQDAALVPLLLGIPLLAGTGNGISPRDWLRLAGVSATFVVATIVLRQVMNRWLIPHITRYRSPDLVVLMTLTILGGVTLIADRIGLPPALGAFAAGLAFGGNRWSEQVDSLILPFREAFSAIFFVSLGLLIDVPGMLDNPLVVLVGGLLLMGIKTLAAALAFAATGRPLSKSWRPAVSLAHVGEFAFVLLLAGGTAGIIPASDQRQLITIAGATLLIAPVLIRWGLKRSGDEVAAPEHAPEHLLLPADSSRQCLVIGMGPVGRAVVSRLETMGYGVTAVDSNPLNLQAFAQHGFETVAGDATDESVLRSAEVTDVAVITICVPIDEVAREITERARRLNPTAQIIVRCRYALQISQIKAAGANLVLSEEARSTRDLVEAIERLVPAK